jgi:adenylate kinase
VRLVILGGSGSGKSTQGQRLCKYFDIPLISTSEILREAISGEKSLPQFQWSPTDPRSYLSVYRKIGFKAPSFYDGFELISVPIYYTNDSGKVINHLKNLAVERQSTEP